MKPISTEIQGFGPHLDTTVDWNRLGAVAAIAAPNGSGKTFLIEAGYAALYGEFPSRPGSLYDAMTQGGTGTASVAFQFSENGRVYLAERTLRVSGKSQSQEALLHELRSGEYVAIAGPKVRDFEAAVRARFGDGATAMATWIAPQGSKGDLCNAAPADRRAVFADLLHFGCLDARSERFRDAAAKAEAVAETLTAQIAGLPDFEAAEALAVEQRNATAAQLSEARAAIVRDEERRDALAATVAELRAAAPEVESLRRETESLAERKASLLDSLSRLDADRRRAVADSSGLAEAEAAEREIPSLAEGVEQLERQAATFAVWNDWRVEDDKLKILADSATGALVGADEAESRARLSDDEQAVLADEESIIEESNLAKDNLARIRSSNAAGDAERNRLRNIIENGRGRITEIEGKLAKRPTTPFGDQCAPCGFLAEWSKLPAELERHRAAVADAERALATVPANEPEPDVAAIARRCEQLRSARKRREQHAAAVEAVRKAEAARDEARDRHDAHGSTEPAKAPDCSAALSEARRILDAKRAVAAKAEACRMAKARVDALDDSVARTRSELSGVEPRLDEARARLESAMAGDTERQAKLKGHVAELESLTARIKESRESIDELTRASARWDSQIERLRADRKAAGAKRDERDRTARKAADLRILQTAFGRKGVQPILIDQAAPALEALAAEIVNRLTDGRVSLRFATQRGLKNGSVSEDFLILAADGRGERDISTFSGGERRILQTTLRIAIMLWTASLHGRSADCLLVDEGFDALDGDNAERMVDLLRDLGNRFGQVVVVTHDEHLAGRIGSRLLLDKGPLGVTVDYSGN